MVLGSTTLLGRLRERLARWKGEDREKRRRFFSSLGLSVEVDTRAMGLSGVVVSAVEALDGGPIVSGSSDASREEGAEPAWEWAYITLHISMLILDGDDG